MINPAITLDTNPASTYIAGLAPGSYWGMKSALETIAGLLSNGQQTAETFPWWEVRFCHTAAVRNELIKRYKPSTVNKMLAALRGVMRQTWRLGLIDAESYRRAVDVENLKSTSLPKGRALEATEISALFQTCAEDDSAISRRDVAILAVFYSTGIRRAELAGLDLSDFDLEDRSLTVRNGKRRKQRTVYLTESGCVLLATWIDERGTDKGPLFVPITQKGEITIRRLRGESVAYILKRRQEKAGVDAFSPHDIRRTFVSGLLDAGVDVFTVQKLAGHADASTTARYDRRGEAAKRRAVESLQIPGM